VLLTARQVPLLSKFKVEEILEAAAVFLGVFQMLWSPWSTGVTTFYSIGGYLPWSDAS